MHVDDRKILMCVVNRKSDHWHQKIMKSTECANNAGGGGGKIHRRGLTERQLNSQEGSICIQMVGLSASERTGNAVAGNY